MVVVMVVVAVVVVVVVVVVRSLLNRYHNKHILAAPQHAMSLNANK